MTRRTILGIAALLWPVVVSMGLLGCEEDQVLTPTRYLERPNAIDFFCVGPLSEDGTEITGLPPYACDEDVAGSDRRLLFALVTNSARSEVAMVDITDGALVDLANQNPGYGFVPVGEAPIHLQVTPDGCAGYVVNHGSCDISVLNINRVLDEAGYRVVTGSAPGAPTARLSVRTASGRLLVRPQDLVVKPDVSGLPPIEACGPLRGRRAYVSLPACGLVADVDLDSGRILQGVRFTGSGVELTGMDPQCPAECVDWAGDGVATGTLASDRPGPLAVTFDGLNLIIGSTTHPHFAVVDIDPDTGTFFTPRLVDLADEERGIRRIRQVWTLQHGWYFLYVISRSGAIHVFDAMESTPEQCEVNPDPQDPLFPDDRVTDTAWEEKKGCLRLSDPDLPARAPTHDSPAIQLPGNRLAVDVAFVELSHDQYTDTSLTSLDPRFLGGTYAYAVTMDGLAYLITVDEVFPLDADPGTSLAPIDFRREDGVHAMLSHQLRSSVNTLPDEQGRPRADEGEAARQTMDGEIITEDDQARRDTLKAREGGQGEPEVTILDPYRVVAETWTLSYMGTVPTTRRTSGQVIRADLSQAGPGEAEFRDDGIGFCKAGVRDGDVLKLIGCEGEEDCGAGFTCYRSFLQAVGDNGICLADDGVEVLEAGCEALVVSPREYVITWAAGDHLFIGPREIRDASPCSEPTMAAYCCDEAGEGDIAGVLDGGRCVGGPLPDAARAVPLPGGGTRQASCFEGLTAYEIRLAEGQYLLGGSRTGSLLHGIPDETDGNHCIDDPERSPLLVSRVSRSEEPFRNHVLELQLDLADEAGAIAPQHGYVIAFDLVAGFEARIVDVSARLPATIAEGPDGHLYVIDQGDENTTGGLQGQVLRLLAGDIALDTNFVVR